MQNDKIEYHFPLFGVVSHCIAFNKASCLNKSPILFIIALLFITNTTTAQSCNSMNIQWQADIGSTCSSMVMTMMHDTQNRPYLYVANKEAGLKIYDISNIAAPSLVYLIPTLLFDTLDVINVSQSGNFLFLALGNTFTNPQKGGIAIVDVTNPLAPVVTDYYVVPASSSGGGIVKVEGNYAYLGAMQSGLVVLDVSNVNNIQFVSQFIPDIHFPPINSPNPNLYNARGMEVKNNIVYLCYDGGGIRIINCVTHQTPIETGHWCNPVMYSPLDHAKAYNNIVLDDTLAYVAVDYCGMEVLNIADTSNITLIGWWNPYNCPNNNWFTSAVHSNEIRYDANCKHAFLSTGKSDMYVIDVSNPAIPDSCNTYGGVANNIGTWGVNIYQSQIYLSYICAAIPFSSNWTGIKLLTYSPCPVGITEIQNNEEKITLSPNPTTNTFTITTNTKIKEIKITNIIGSQSLAIINITPNNTATIDITNLSNGIYFIKIKTDKGTINKKIMNRFHLLKLSLI